MSVHINRITPGEVMAVAISPTLITVGLGTSDTTASFDSVPAARQWVDALDRAVSRLEVQQRGMAA
jgi:hypothetical protein